MAAAALFVVAQPQVLCALHCALFRDMDASPTAPVEHHTVAMACNHGTTLTSGCTIPVSGVSLATFAAVEAPAFGVPTPVATFASTLATPTPVSLRVDTPPPRA